MEDGCHMAWQYHMWKAARSLNKPVYCDRWIDTNKVRRAQRGATRIVKEELESISFKPFSHWTRLTSNTPGDV